MKTSTYFSLVSNRNKHALLILLTLAFLVPQMLLAAGTFYWGGTAADAWSTAKWSTTNAVPYATSFTTKSDAVFNLANSQLTGPSTIADVLSITANENVTFVTAGGANIRPYINSTTAGIAPITVATGKVFDFGAQGFATGAGSGFRKEGPGELRITGINSCLPGGFILNAGTLATLGSNAAGVGTLTINGGTLATNGARMMNSTGLVIGGNFTFGANTYAIADGTTLVGDASKNLTFAATAPVSLGTSAARTITLGGSGKLILNGVISGSGSRLLLEGNAGGGLTLGAANTYDGGTTITSGTLLLAAAGVLADAGAITLNGGTLKTTTTFSETMGTLALTNNSTIALQTGVNTLNFANSQLTAWTSGKTLTITDWTGTPGESGTAGKILVGTDNTGLTVEQLAQISFTGFTGAQILSTGEVVPSSGAALLTPPALTAATGATVDGPFDITFTDDPAWRAAITAVTISAALTPITTGVEISAGKITITPATASSSLIRISGSKTLGVIATGYSNVYPFYQTVSSGAPTANSTATIGSALAAGTTQTITCTAKDQYNNLVSGYSFKYDATVTNSDASTAESYTIDGSAHTSTASDVSVVATTNASGVATFTAALPATIDGGDGLSIQVQLSNGTTNIGSASTYTSQTYNLTGTKNSADLPLSALSDVTVLSGELTISEATEVKSITVAPGAKLALGTNTLTASNGITLQSDATGTATMTDGYNTPTVIATVKQYVEAGRNWYVSAPISAAGYEVLNRGTSVVEWNEATKAWDNVTTGTLAKGKGYIQVATSSPSVTGSTGTVDFIGTTNSGDVSVALSRTESGSSRGFNLVGNPYPSYLDWSLVIADGDNSTIGSTMWYRTKNTGGTYTFATYNGTSNESVSNSANTSITKSIPPMQAFWVRVNPNVGITTYSTSMTYKNTMREHRLVTANTFKAPKLDVRKRLRLQVSNGTNADEAVLYFDTKAQDAFDAYDSPKMTNGSASIPEIYTQIGSEKVVINGMADVKYDTEIPLGFVTGQAGNLSISSTELTNFEAGTTLILKDKLLNTETDLSEGAAYNFSAGVTTTGTDRFSLTFRAPGTTTGVKGMEKLNAQVFFNTANQIMIIAPVKCNYNIYNTIGQNIHEGVTTTDHTTLNAPLKAGMYILKLAGSGREFTTKVIIK